MEKRFVANSVFISTIINKAISLDTNFKSSNDITLRNWVHHFTKRRNSVIRARTRVRKMTAAAMEPVHRNYCKRVMTVYKNYIKILSSW